MAKFTVQDIKNLSKNKENIRNIGVIAHIDHGKCISGDSRIFLADGNVEKAEEIYRKISWIGSKIIEDNEKTVYDASNSGFFVFSLNKKTAEIEKKPIKCAWKLRGGKLIMVKLRNGLKIKTTLGHKFMVLDGKNFNEKKAEELKIGDNVACIKENNSEIAEGFEIQDLSPVEGNANTQKLLIQMKKISKNIRFSEVISKEICYGDEVYDFTVEDNHNFVAEGMVIHNTTFSDNLLSRAGMISEELAGKQLFMDYDPQEQERGITIYAANVSMVHEFNNERYLVNMIDTPGHVDFSGDVTRAMRAVDGVIVLVDAVEGIMPQTETVLMQALREKVRPVLFINKVDRLIKELQLTPEAMQTRFVKIISEVNSLIGKLAPEEFREKWKLNVEKGQVAFGSALRNWAISIPFMKKSGIDFKQIIEHVKQGKDKELAKKAPLHEVILDMVVRHLPNPREAQKYRLSAIWKGDLNSEIGKSMANCDENGKLVCVVTNVQNDPYAGTICTARIFSGTVKDGMDINGLKSHLTQRVQQVGIYAGPRKLRIESLGSGNIVALTGVDFSAGETIVEKEVVIEPFEKIEHIFEPVVTKSIELKKTADLPKLIKVLKDRAREDPTIKVQINEQTGEILVSGLGELHIEAKIERFLKDRGIDIIVSPPIVVYRESVKKKSQAMEGKSPNRHNRFYLSVEPLEKDVYNLLVKGELRDGKVRIQDREIVRKKLIENGMSKEEAFNVKDIYGHNLYLDMTKGIQYLNEVEEMIIDAFHSIVDEGPLAKEPCIAMKVKLLDAKLHEDAIHRGPAQVIPAVRFSIKNAMLEAQALIIEPKQIIRIDAPSDVIGGAIKEVSNRRGQILDMEESEGYSTIKAKVPVAEIFGFEAALKGSTGGKGFYSLIDQVFEPLPENMQEKVILEIRKRKGMPEEIPKVEHVL